MSNLSQKVATVNFKGDTLITLEKDGEHYVAIRPIVENMGLEWSTQKQKLDRTPKFGCVHMNTPTNGGTQKMLCIPIRKLNGWLFSINPQKVRADIRHIVEQYQEECFTVLHDYWNEGVAINPRLTSTDTLPLRNAVNMATGVLKLDYSTIYKMIHQRFGIAEIRDLNKEQIGQAVEYVHRLMLSGGQYDDQVLIYNEMWRKIGLIRQEENRKNLNNILDDLDRISQQVINLTKLNSVLYDVFVEPCRPKLTNEQHQIAQELAVEFLQNQRAMKTLNHSAYNKGL